MVSLELLPLLPVFGEIGWKSGGHDQEEKMAFSDQVGLC